ncbi:DUF4097 family beta strand repeat-containing protein [Niallia sp. 01092]|uniref:DUF4097 family beta strand repeat-containing protein n=1 Tax=unclassified Niallia TaxID=2837522 RepID=UPI003FD1D442
MNRKKLSLFAACLLIVGLVGAASTFKQQKAKQTVAETKVIERTDFNEIYIDSDDAKVEVIPTQDMKATVELNGIKQESSKLNFTANIEGKRLNIKLRHSQPQLVMFNFFYKTLEMKVYLPTKQYDKLNITNLNGRVDVEDVSVTKADIHTSNGRIELKKIAASDVEATTNNGRILLNDVTGTVNGETSNGRIELLTDHLDRDVNLRSYNGSITIESEKEPKNATFDIDTNNGSVDVFGKNDDHTVVGKGEYLIKLKTSNGSIEVTHE